MSNRDNFAPKVKEHLAKRVGTLCSNPDCCVLTFGPQMDVEKSINIGVAAHIEGAAPGSSRYNPKQSSEERTSISNGIWLCQNCAKLIDNDVNRFTVSVLHLWKTQAEERAKKALGNERVISPSFYDAKSILLISRQTKTDWPAREKANAWGKTWNRSKITIRPISMPRNLEGANFPIVFDKKILPPKHHLYNVAYQNLGKVIDEKIMIRITFDAPAIYSVNTGESTRVQIIEGGKKTSSFVVFYIPESLPKEKMLLRIISVENYIPKVEFWTKSSGNSDDVYIVDMLYDS